MKGGALKHMFRYALCFISKIHSINGTLNNTYRLKPLALGDKEAYLAFEENAI